MHDKLDLSIDIGYSNVKVVAGINGNICSEVFSSALAIAPRGSDSAAVAATETYLYDGTFYLCGKPAISPHVREQINCRSNDHIIKYAAVYIAAAARNANVELHEIGALSVGLPFEMHRPYSQALREMLTSFTVNGETVTPTQLNVFCQGAAAAFAAGVEGQMTGENGLLIDIGGNTMIAIAASNGIPVSLGSQQFSKLGMLAAAEQLSRSLSNGTNCSLIKAAEIIKTRVYQGQDVSGQVNKALSNHAESIVAILEDTYGGQIDEMDTILLSGGGADCICPYLPAKWATRIKVQTEPITANARGYYYRSQGPREA